MALAEFVEPERNLDMGGKVGESVEPPLYPTPSYQKRALGNLVPHIALYLDMLLVACVE